MYDTHLKSPTLVPVIQTGKQNVQLRIMILSATIVACKGQLPSTGMEQVIRQEKQKNLQSGKEQFAADWGSGYANGRMPMGYFR